MSGLLYPKPKLMATVRAERRQAASKARSACVSAVWFRAKGRCERPDCGVLCIPPDLASSPALACVGAVHEVVLRSQGGDATDPTNCVLLCRLCHEALHAHCGEWTVARMDGGFTWTRTVKVRLGGGRGKGG